MIVRACYALKYYFVRLINGGKNRSNNKRN